MSYNYKILVEYGSKMRKNTKAGGYTVIGLIGSGLSRKAVNRAAKEIMFPGDEIVSLKPGVALTIKATEAAS